MNEYTICMSNQAQDDYDSIFLYVVPHSLQRAKDFTKKLLDKIKSLKHDALRGTIDRSNDCRFILFKPYYIYYDVDEKTNNVEIVHIRHTARAPYKRY